MFELPKSDFPRYDPNLCPNIGPVVVQVDSLGPIQTSAA